MVVEVLSFLFCMFSLVTVLRVQGLKVAVRDGAEQYYGCVDLHDTENSRQLPIFYFHILADICPYELLCNVCSWVKVIYSQLRGEFPPHYTCHFTPRVTLACRILEISDTDEPLCTLCCGFVGEGATIVSSAQLLRPPNDIQLSAVFVEAQRVLMPWQKFVHAACVVTSARSEHILLLRPILPNISSNASV